MNDEAKTSLVVYRLELFPWVQGSPKFEALAAELATAQRNSPRPVGRFRANAVALAEATFHTTLGVTRS
jgi:hypothetical protein